MSDVKNVTTGKAKVGGAVSVAATTATLPTSASSALASGWTNLGYISDSGLTNSNSPETNAIKAWGGDTVLTTQTSKEDTFQFTLIETKNADVLKFIYGDKNVTSAESTGITVKATTSEAEAHAVVIDMVLREGTLKRVVIPNAVVSSIGDIVYNDSDAVGYEVTLTAYPDATGLTHYEYIK